MKTLLLGILLAVCIQSSAVVKRADGSVILSRDEAMALYDIIDGMVTAGKSQAAVIRALQSKVDSLENGKCI